MYLDTITHTWPTPTLVDGKPQDWAPSSTVRTPWGRVAVTINSIDYTFWRDTPAVIESWSSLDPFGDGPATIVLPQATPWDDIRALFPPGSPVDLWLLDDTETVDGKLWAGTIIGYDDRSVGVALDCTGSLLDMDRFVAKPDFATADGLGTRDTGDHLVDRLNDLISTYDVNLSPLAPVTTGIVQRNPGAFEPLITGWAKELLSKAQVAATPGTAPLTDTVMWTMDCQDRQPTLNVRSWTTNVHTVTTGTPGVSVQLKDDYMGVPSAIFGHGTGEDNCVWHNTKWPHNRVEPPPAWPAGYLPYTALTPYNSTHAPNIDRIKRELINTGFGSGLSPIGGPFVASDFVDGPIGWFKIASGLVFWGDALGGWTSFGQADWENLFGDHGTAALGAPFYLPIYQDTRTKRYNYDSRGVNLGPNPNYDPDKPRIEHFVDYGKSNKFAAAIEARRKIETYDTDSALGTIRLQSDPDSGGSRFEIRAGHNLDLVGYRGATRRLHVAQAVHDVEQLTTTLTVDEQVRDYLSIQAIVERDRKAKADPAARIRTEIATSNIREDRVPPWDCEAGSGIIGRTAIQFGAFTIIRFPASRFGSISSIRLRTTDINGGAYPTVFTFAIWGRAVTSDQVVVAATDGTGSVNNIDWDGIQPYWPAHLGGEPTNLVYAAGRSSSCCGWWPNGQGDHNNPDEQADITGEYRDEGTWEFVTDDPPWLYLSVLSLASCYIEGRMFLSATQPDS